MGMRNTTMANDVDRVIARYDEIVTANRSATWDTFLAVAEDSDGDVIYEVLDTGQEMGFNPDTDGWQQALDEALQSYKMRLRERMAAAI